MELSTKAIGRTVKNMATEKCIIQKIQKKLATKESSKITKWTEEENLSSKINFLKVNLKKIFFMVKESCITTMKKF